MPNERAQREHVLGVVLRDVPPARLMVTKSHVSGPRAKLSPSFRQSPRGRLVQEEAAPQMVSMIRRVTK